MYAITGITGQVGGAAGEALLAAGKPVRAVVRDAAKGSAWAAKGCEIALAALEDAAALTAAFRGAEAVFILPPPTFDPSPGFPEARAVAAAVKQALAEARPRRVVHLSTIGAQATEPNLLTQQSIIEQTLAELPLPVTSLRPAWYMENFAWDVADAREHSVFRSFLQPVEKPFPMIAARDVGRAAADLLVEDRPGAGKQIVELEADRRSSPSDVAAAFAEALGRPVRVEVVPRETWQALFTEQGMRNPTPRMRMIDGFNEGWIDFERGAARSLKGHISLEAVVRDLVTRAG